MYHQVSPSPLSGFARYTVTPDAFAAQMRWLAHSGYVPISLDLLVEHRCGWVDLPPRPIVITFDDGFRELTEHAVPTLRSLGFTATFFLVAGSMGGNGRWLREEIGAEIPLMDWRTARDLEAAGFHCGAHTMSHPRLNTLSDAACGRELYDSRRLLEDELGHEVVHLAYPFGSFDERVRAIAAETGYRSACSTRPGLSDSTDDLLALRRISIYGHDSLLAFICRLKTAQSPRELVRRTLRSLKRQTVG